MNKIIIKHIIEEDKINISFDLQDETLSFPEIYLEIEADIDLNLLLIKLTELIELDRELEFQFEDNATLVESDSKIKLIKETLEEIYCKFNEQIEAETNTVVEN